MYWIYVIVSAFSAILGLALGYLFGYLNGVSDTQAYNYILKHGIEDNTEGKDNV